MPMRSVPFGAKASMEPTLLALEFCRIPHGVRKSSAERASGRLSIDLWFAGANDESAEQPCNLVREERDGLEASVTFDGETLVVGVTAVEELVVTGCRVTFRHAFASDELVLLNGYQSRTETAERPAWSSVRGLQGAPSRLASRLSPEGMNVDLKANDPDAQGRPHGYTYATFRRDNGMVLLGSLDETRGFSVIRTSAEKGEVSFEAECPVRPLEPGRQTTLMSCAIVRGTMKQCYDRWFELMDCQARPARPVVGYTSWYKHYDGIDQAKLLQDLEDVRALFDRKVSVDARAVHKVFQIDDGFCRIGDWLDVDRGAFPNGLGPIARCATRAGFVPGLWFAPFICEKDSRLFAERPEWLLRDDEGDPIRVSNNWSGAYALNTRDVDVRSYVLEFLQTATREWGFGLLKVDFLYAACVRAHSGLNRGELMADAIDLLRTGAGEKTLLLGCRVPLASAFGKLDYCRIGPHVGSEAHGAPSVRFLMRAHATAKSALANIYARAPLDGRAFGNDPDVFFLGDESGMSSAQRDELLLSDADLGRVMLTSDDATSWDTATRQLYQQALDALVERHG